MTSVEILQLDLQQISRACQVQPEWIIERVRSGLLCEADDRPAEALRFDSLLLRRARRMHATERDFDANPELAALVADLLEQIDRLRQRAGQTAES